MMFERDVDGLEVEWGWVDGMSLLDDVEWRVEDGENDEKVKLFSVGVSGVLKESESVVPSRLKKFINYIFTISF